MIDLVKKVNIENYRNIYIVGDIHGCFSLLDRLIYSVGFDKENDLLICVGDLVGRGQESSMAIEYLKEDWFTTVVGNHDIIFFDRDDHDYGRFYSALDEIERNLLINNEWSKEFLKYKEKVSFFIEIHKDGEILDLVHHAAFEIKHINEYYDLCDDYKEFDNKKIIKLALWNRDLAVELRHNNYSKMVGRDEEIYHFENIDGVRNIYTGHNIIQVPLMITDINKKSEFLELGNIKFLDTGAFFTDKDYMIGRKVHEDLDYGMTIFNVNKNKFERICYK